MSKNERIQRKRTKGWKMPANTIYVGRPTIFGNPFVGPGAVDAYREWMRSADDPASAIQAMFRQRGVMVEIVGSGQVYASDVYEATDELEAIQGWNLSCWCPLDRPCHADILLELANKD